MKKVLSVVLLVACVSIETLTAAQPNSPQSVQMTYIPAITSSLIVIDNRSSNLRQNNYHTFCATGTGTWAAQMQYSDESSNPISWTSFLEESLVDQSSMNCLGASYGYHNFVRFLISGTASVNYSGIKNVFIPIGSSGGGGGTGTVTHTTGPLTLDLPVFGNGAADIKVGTKTGTGTVAVMNAGPTIGTATLTSPTISGATINTSTINSPTIVTPTIASFTNAQHNHTNAAGGGQLTDAALSAAVSIAKGGTGQATKIPAFNALSPLSTKGDLIGFDSGNNVRVAVGANGNCLLADSSQTAGFVWGNCAAAAGLQDPNANGIVVRTALNTTVARAISSPPNNLTVTNGNGVAGNISLEIAPQPIISDYTNATHVHQGATTGGQLTDSALSAAVGIAKGGTGATNKTTAFDALSPLAVKGDLLGFDGASNVSIAVGTNGQCLQADSGESTGLKWAACTAGTSALLDPGGNGIVVRTALNTTINRSLTSTANNLTITNPTGVAGNINLDLAAQPSITDFTNATHTHANTTNGGQLTDAALSAAVGIAKGGTGQVTATAAFNALGPLTTKGDVLSNDGSDDVRLAVGTDGFCLVADSAQTSGLRWSTCNPGGVGLGDPGGNGIVVRTALNTTINRQITATANTLSITNPTGVAGDINLAFAAQPAIADFTNMAHTHANAANGGQIGITGIAVASLSGGGTGSKLGTTLGTLTSGNCVQFDASGNLIDSGGVCTGAGAPSGAKYILQQPDGGLASAQSLSALATGILKSTTTTGVLSIATAETDYVTPSGSGTLANKTLTTPTIASFTNATHNHTNAAGGGQLTDAALSAAVSISKGGTGQVTALAAFNALSVLTTKGDLLGFDSGNNVRVAVGTNGLCLQADSTQTAGIKWALCTAGTSALLDPGSNGIVIRTALNTTTARSLVSANANIVVTNADGTAGNPTITASLTPTISSFVNATHTHTAAAGGGQLTDAALSAAVSIPKGGTGQATKTPAFNALAPGTTKGDVIVFDGTNNVRFPIGTNGRCIGYNSATATGLDYITCGSTTTGLPSTGSTGIVVETVVGTTAARAITAGTSISVTNGNGVAGNPTIALVNNPTIGDFTSAQHSHQSAAGGSQLGIAALAPAALTGNGTKLLTFTGLATSARCLHTDGNGNAVVAAADCGSGSGGAPTTSTYILQTADVNLTGAQVLSTLSSGLMKVANGTGVISTATAGTDYITPNGSETLANKTLTTPVIANFSNAQHTHLGASTGGQLSIGIFPSGTLQGAGNKLLTYNNVNAPVVNNCAKFDSTGAIVDAGAVCGGSGSSPLTTKGDLFTFSTVVARLPVGADTQVLTADSTATTGIKWAAPITGVTMAHGLGCGVSFTDGTHLSIMNSASGTNVCNYGASWNPFQFTSAATAQITGGSDNTTAYIYIDTSGAVIFGHNGTAANYSCSGGCTATAGITSVPYGSVVLAQWPVVSGAFSAASGSFDKRSWLSAAVVAAGTGVTSSVSGMTNTISVDTAVVPLQVAVPALVSTACTKGSFALDLAANKRYDCFATNTWRVVTYAAF